MGFLIFHTLLLCCSLVLFTYYATNTRLLPSRFVHEYPPRLHSPTFVANSETAIFQGRGQHLVSLVMLAGGGGANGGYGGCTADGVMGLDGVSAYALPSGSTG